MAKIGSLPCYKDLLEPTSVLTRLAPNSYVPMGILMTCELFVGTSRLPANMLQNRHDKSGVSPEAKYVGRVQCNTLSHTCQTYKVIAYMDFRYAHAQCHL
jgi:hypothetical protein